MRIQVISDLHIECEEKPVSPYDYINPSADVLILAGDIGSLYKYDQLYNFLSETSKLFKLLIYVPGNHEYYEISGMEPLTMSQLKFRLEELRIAIPNLVILDKSSILLGNICIAGCTLWSDPLCDIIPRFVVRMKNMNKEQYALQHKEDLEFIENMIEYCKDNNYRLISVTHYPPTYKTLEGFRRKTKFLSLYATDLDRLLSGDNIDTWICGHTHNNFDFDMNGTRIVSNQKGKGKIIDVTFSKDFTINISEINDKCEAND